MKNKISAAIIAAMLLLGCLFAGCSQEPATATPDEAQTAATLDEAQSTAADTTAAQSTDSAQASTEATQKTTTKSTDSTQPTTQKPVQDNIPADNITDGNVNPNLSGIISNVIAEMGDSELRSISLTMDSVTIKKGEVAGIQIIYEPEYAVPKTCTAKSDSKCVSVEIKNGYLTITGKSEGSAAVTVTSYNGATVQCAVTVTADQGPDSPDDKITDDTVLAHSKLCTRENAQRWLDAVAAYCDEAGLKKNTALSGDSAAVSTGEYTEDGSFNSYKELIVSAAAGQIDTYTGKNYADFEYNCILEADGSEFRIAITLYRISAE